MMTFLLGKILCMCILCENHKEKLVGVCRVCGLRFKLKKGNPKSVSAFREPILYLYDGYDIGCDKEGIHPPHVCEKCRSALSKVQKAITEGKRPNTMLPGNLPDFSPHGEDECSICNHKGGGRPVKKHIKSKCRVQEVTAPTIPASLEDFPSTIPASLIPASLEDNPSTSRIPASLEDNLSTSRIPASLEDIPRPSTSTIPASLEDIPRPCTSTIPASLEDIPSTSTIPASLEDIPSTSTIPASLEDIPSTSTIPASLEDIPSTSTIPASLEDIPSTSTIPASLEDIPSTSTIPASLEDIPSTSTCTMSVIPTEQPSVNLLPTSLSDEDIVEEAHKHCYIHLATKDNGTLVLAKPQEINIHFAISQQLSVNPDRTWELLVWDKCLPSSSPVKAELPTMLTKSNCRKFFTILSHCFICNGNVGFETLLDARREGTDCVEFRKLDGSVAAREETGRRITEGKLEFSRTIRHVECHLLIPPDRWSTKCEQCVSYSHQLRSSLSRSKGKQQLDTSHNSTVPNKYFSREQLTAKLEDTQKEKAYQKACADRMKRAVGKEIDSEGCNLTESQHCFLRSILESSTDTFQAAFEKDSPKEFLFKQQFERAQQHDSRTMRWHPIMVRWCLAIYHTSPAAYKLIRESGFLSLPHTSTLLQYSKFTEPTPGINADILAKLAQESKVEHIPKWKRNVTLIWDEMKIKSKLVYSKSTGELVGFTDLGSISEELKGFEKRCRAQQDESSSDGPDLATHVLACMVRGIFTNLEFVFAYYPCLTFTSDQLYDVVWDATSTLMCLGFHVRAFICDGASPNRRFYRIHGNGEAVVYWTWNPHTDFECEKIFFFCDVPHLIKTARNNMENSGAHNRTRHLHYDGQEISWRHIQNVYEWDLDRDRNAVGVRMLHKVTADHIYLTPSLRMRVNLAAQVLSKTVGTALAMQNRHDTVSTRKFVETVNRFFDCLNVKHSRQGLTTRNDDLLPYRDPADVRFVWLEEKFLGFLREWEDEAQATQNLTKDQKNRRCLSQQTLEGFRITVASFTTLTKMLLQEEGVTYVLSDKFNQDPIEQHFSKQRRRRGANENPTLQEFGQNEVNIHVAQEMIRAVRSGNSGGRVGNVQIDFSDDTPLPKRPRKR